MSALKELLERVERAEGPDRDYDWDLAFLDGWKFDEISDTWTMPDGHWDQFLTPPRYTASLDAAVALVERKLPGHHWSVSRQCEYPSLAFCDYRFAAFVGDYGSPKRAEGPTPAIAVIKALLRALIASELQSSQPSIEQSK